MSWPYEYPGPKYQDREEARKVLSSRFLDYQDQNLIVIAIPNGGVLVAAVIAEELRVELYYYQNNLCLL